MSSPIEIYDESGIQRLRGTQRPAGGGSQPVEVVRVPIAFDTPDLVLTGIPIYTPTAGEILAFGSLSITEAWDGTTPQIIYSTTGKPDYLDTKFLGTANTDFLGNGSIYSLPFQWVSFFGGNGLLLTAADLIVWVDDGAGGDPGSMQGAGEIVLVILAVS